jgi:integrase
MGMIYRPKYRDKDGTLKESAVYWIKYYRHGRAYRESSKSGKETEARKLLKLREGEISKGKLPGVYFERVTFNELAKDVERDYVLNNMKSLKRLRESLEHLSGFFEGYRVPQITSDKVNTYIEQRISDGAKNATINRELSALKRMLQLGAEQTPPKVDRVPYIPMLAENNVREGFLEHSQYLALIEKLPEYLKPVLAFGYTYGWRHAEIINLTWDKVDLRNGVVRLEPGTTKNKEGRTVYLDEEMLAMFRKLFSQRRLDINRVFLRDGEPIQRFDKAWKKACKDAGLKGTLFHDLRRTAIRNLVRSGVPQTVCMAISGHKTPSVFQRYDITSDRDLQEAMLKRSTYIQGQGQDATVKVSGKVTSFQQKEVNANVR